MASEGEGLLTRVAAIIARAEQEPGSGREQRSILTQAATAFAKRPVGAESTIPTGFDPQAASLFEAVVEAAFLVAKADGVFDEPERPTFEAVGADACQQTVQPSSLHALVSDLVEQLDEDGLDRRLEMLTGIIISDEHKVEVLRIAALMAHASGGVHDSERVVLDKLAAAFGLAAGEVTAALDRAGSALSG